MTSSRRSTSILKNTMNLWSTTKTDPKKEENKALEQKNVYVEKYSTALEERTAFLESIGREKNIEIVGLKPRDSENIKAVIETLAKNISLNPNNIWNR